MQPVLNWTDILTSGENIISNIRDLSALDPTMNVLSNFNMTNAWNIFGGAVNGFSDTYNLTDLLE